MDSTEMTSPAWIVEAMRAVREDEAAARAQQEAAARAAAEQAAARRRECAERLVADLQALGVPADPERCEWIVEEDGREPPLLRLIYRVEDYTFAAVLIYSQDGREIERYLGVHLARQCDRCQALERSYMSLRTRLDLGRALLAATVPWRCVACADLSDHAPPCPDEDPPAGDDAPPMLYVSESDLVRDAHEAYAHEREQQARAEAAAAAAVAAQRRELLSQALARVWGYRPTVESDRIAIGGVTITLDPILPERLVAVRPCDWCGEETRTSALTSLAALGAVLAGEATYYHDERICPALQPTDRTQAEVQRFARALRGALEAWIAGVQDED